MGFVQLIASFVLYVCIGGVIAVTFIRNKNFWRFVGISAVLSGITIFLLTTIKGDAYSPAPLGWFPILALASVPFLTAILTSMIIKVTNNARSIGKFRRVNKFQTRQLAIIMEDVQWCSMLSKVHSEWAAYHTQVGHYQTVYWELNSRCAHRGKFHVRAGLFRIKYSWSSSLRIYRKRRLILSADDGVLFVDVDYLPDWATFPLMITEATERLEEQTSALQVRLEKKICGLHQSEQGLRTHIEALAEVFLMDE